MKQFMASTIIIFTLLSCAKVNEISIIPRPNSIVINSGEFVLDAETNVEYNLKNDKLTKIANEFLDRIRITSGLDLSQNKASRKKIVFRIDERFILGDEGYSLIIDENSIIISSKSEAGVFYGLQSLYQLIDPAIFANDKNVDVPIYIPSVTIIDQPRFTYRGSMLDVGRYFASKEFVKKYIDILAFHKLNKFHWHLTEDQGWRIEIKKYPDLTNIGSVRKETEGDGIEHKGFYTQEDIKEIIEYAKERYITVIPEIEMPGHSRAVLAAYPELSCTGKKQDVSTSWGVHEDIYCAGNEKTFIFLQNVLNEVIELFPSKYIHIGGDEAPKIRWESCKKCQLRIKNEGLKNEYELQSYFIKRIEKYLLSKNKLLIGWDEILEGGIAPNATVMSWRGTEGGIKAAKAGHDVIMTPNSHCYFDYYQARYNEPYAIGGFTPLEKVYLYEPTPEELSNEEKKHILGAQANLWTEFISTTDYAEYMLLPRLSALSEVVWTNNELKNYSDFEKRMIDQYARYGFLNWNYRVPTPIGIENQKIIYEPEKISFVNPIPGSKIIYTLNGKDPDLNSKVYTSPINISNSTLIKARTIMPDGTFGRVIFSAISLIDSTKNGINFKYYEGNWTKLPNFDNETFAKYGKTTKFRLDEFSTREDHFAIVFESRIIIDEAGEYTFYLTSDDGSKLFIDEQLLIDNDGSHSKKIMSNNIILSKGIHNIRVEYFEDYEGQELELFIEGNNFPKQEIPASMLLFSK